MKANELRIGNLILNDRAVNTVKGIHTDSAYLKTRQCNFIDARMDLIKPIPLTTEWLEKLGWEYYNGKTEGILTMDFGCKMDVDYKDGELLIKSHYEGEYLYRNTHVKYVHQLQNLYFALTGEELTIKEAQK